MERFPSRSFDASQELKKVSREPSIDRKEALAGWKEKYLAQRRLLAETQARLVSQIRENPNVTREELDVTFAQAAEKGNFSEAQRQIASAALDIFEQRHTTIRGVREKYQNDRDLFKVVFGIAPIGPVHIEEGPVNLSFICSNALDLSRVVNFNKDGLAAFYSIVLDLAIYDTKGGAMFTTPRLPELKDMIIVGKGSMQDKRLGDIKTHEEQHMFRHILLSAAERVQQNRETLEHKEPWQKLLQECVDSIEIDLEDELLAMNKGNAQNVSRELSQYFNGFIQGQVNALQRQLTASEETFSQEDVQKVIGELESDQFREKLWKKVSNGNTAYARLRNIGNFSHEEITAFLDLEPLSQWPKLEQRILGESWKVA